MTCILMYKFIIRAAKIKKRVVVVVVVVDASLGLSDEGVAEVR